jgi:hypothetical protein
VLLASQTENNPLILLYNPASSLFTQLTMACFEVKQSPKLNLTSYSGLALIGQCCQAAQGEAVMDPKLPVSQGMKTSGLVKAMVGLLALGKSDFEAIEPFRPIERSWKRERRTLRLIVRVTERTIDKRGQRLPMPEIDLEGWWTSLTVPMAEVIALYAHHGMHEQFHSEIKSDLDLERLPSGKHVPGSAARCPCEETGAGLWTQRYPTRQGVRCAARAALASSFAVRAAQRFLSTEIPGSAPVEGRDSSRSRKMTSRHPARDDFRSRKAVRRPWKDPRQTEDPDRQADI